jgi:trimeric autotransporter adhesin
MLPALPAGVRANSLGGLTVRAAILTLVTFVYLATTGQVALAASGNSITASPSALTFSYQIGSAALPAAQTMQVQSSPAGLNFTVAVAGAPFNAAWLLVSASTGKAPASLKVEVNPTGLAAGSYAGVITMTAMVGSQAVLQTVAATLLVSTAAPTVTATPMALNFTYVTGSPIPAPSLTSAFVLSSSGSALSAQLSITGAPWLKVTPTGNVSLIGLLNTIAVTVDPTGLAPKAYSGTITLSSPAAVDKTVKIAVTLTVNAAAPMVTGTWPVGVIQGAAQTITTVEGSAYYANSTVAVSGFTPDATVSVTDGTTTVTETFRIPVYQGTATGLRVAAASPMPSGVTGSIYSQVLAATGGTGPYAYSLAGGALPAGVAFAGVGIGGTPTAAGSYSFVVQVTDSSSPMRTAYAFNKITVAPAGSLALSDTIAAAGLPLGTMGAVYGPVTLTATGGAGGPYLWSAVNLPAGMTLSAAGVLTGTPATDGALGAVVGVVVSDTAILATLPAGDLLVAGVLRVAVTTPAPGGGASNEGQFHVYGPGPQVLAVTNSASMVQGSVAPGELISIFGLGLGPAALTIFDPSMPPIPVALPSAGPATSVTINGTAAPLLYTSATQIGAIVPHSVAGASAQVIVTYNGIASQPFTVAVTPVQPGVYSLAASGQGAGAILNYNAATGDYTINSLANAAARGSIVVIYMTGAGTTNSAVDNLLIPASPAVTPVLLPSVTIGGLAATVVAAQAPPGSVPGLVQINVTVPNGLIPSPALAVVVTVGGVPSQTGLTMAVK